VHALGYQVFSAVNCGLCDTRAGRSAIGNVDKAICVPAFVRPQELGLEFSVSRFMMCSFAVILAEPGAPQSRE